MSEDTFADSSGSFTIVGPVRLDGHPDAAIIGFGPATVKVNDHAKC